MRVFLFSLTFALFSPSVLAVRTKNKPGKAKAASSSSAAASSTQPATAASQLGVSAGTLSETVVLTQKAAALTLMSLMGVKGKEIEREQKNLQSQARMALEKFSYDALIDYEQKEASVEAVREEARASGTAVNPWKLLKVIIDTNMFGQYVRSFIYSNVDVYLRADKFLDTFADELRAFVMRDDPERPQNQEEVEKALYVEFLRLLTMGKAMNHGTIKGYLTSAGRDELNPHVVPLVGKLGLYVNMASSNEEKLWASLHTKLSSSNIHVKLDEGGGEMIVPEFPTAVSSAEDITEQIDVAMQPSNENSLTKELLLHIAHVAARSETQYADNNAAIYLTLALMKAALQTRVKLQKSYIMRMAFLLPTYPIDTAAPFPHSQDLFLFMVESEGFLHRLIRELGMAEPGSPQEAALIDQLDILRENLDNLIPDSHKVVLQLENFDDLETMAETLASQSGGAVSGVSSADGMDDMDSRKMNFEAKLEQLTQLGSSSNSELCTTLADVYGPLAVSSADPMARKEYLKLFKMGVRRLRSDIESDHFAGKPEELTNLAILLRAASKVVQLSRDVSLRPSIYLDYLRSSLVLVSEMLYRDEDRVSALVPSDVPATDLQAATEVVLAALPESDDPWRPTGAFMTTFPHWILSLLASAEVPEDVLPPLLKSMALVEQIRLPNNLSSKALSPKIVAVLKAVASEVSNLRLKTVAEMLASLVRSSPFRRSGLTRVLALLDSPEALVASRGIEWEGVENAKRAVKAAMEGEGDALKMAVLDLKEALEVALTRDRSVATGQSLDFQSEGIVVPRLQGLL